MSGGQQSQPEPSEVVVQLLDSSEGSTPLKSWRFEGKSSISIGRDAEREVEVNDPYVSRTHAVLELREASWMLVSRGRNGVYINGQQITEHSVTGDVTFRLGKSGPILAFKTTAQRDERAATLCFDTFPEVLLNIDKSKLQQEVGEISSRDEFQRLQEQARMLRRKRMESHGQPDPTLVMKKPDSSS